MIMALCSEQSTACDEDETRQVRLHMEIGPHIGELPYFIFAGTGMSKSTTTYWNPLAPDQRTRWTPIKGLEGGWPRRSH